MALCELPQELLDHRIGFVLCSDVICLCPAIPQPDNHDCTGCSPAYIIRVGNPAAKPLRDLQCSVPVQPEILCKDRKHGL